MIEKQLHVAIQNLIANLDVGTMPGVIYDSAILGALKNDLGYTRFPHIVRKVLQSQKEDGTWGADYYNAYDRLLSTTAALYMMVELSLDKQSKYQNSFYKGLNWVNDNQKSVLQSDHPLPAGFEFIYTWLINEIMSKNTDISISISKLERAREKKLSILGEKKFSVYNPLFYSMEGVVENKAEAEQLAAFQNRNGSLCSSPASTSVFIKHKITSVIPGAMRYIQQDAITNENLSYHFGDYTYFNIAYSLYPILKTNYKFGRELIYPISELVNNWGEIGISFGKSFPIFDADDTAIALAAMKYLGIPGVEKRLQSLAVYESDSYFKTYLIENDPALLTNTHVLEAYLQIPGEHNSKYIDKIQKYISGLGENIVLNSKFIASNIMQIGNLLLSILPGLNSLAQIYVDFLQKEIYNKIRMRVTITVEEKALAIFGLVRAKKYQLNIDEDLVHELYISLKSSMTKKFEYIPSFMWSSKVQYAPLQVDKAYILSAMLSYNEVYKKEPNPNNVSQINQ